MPSPIELVTRHGAARAHVREVAEPRAVLVLGHGAGGGVDTPDLAAATRAAVAEGASVVLVEQPYRVAGRRSPAPAAQLDASWLEVIAALPVGLGEVPLFVGGRSSGGRVACRTAAEAGAAGVICLAFPVHPPGRPEKNRLDELDGVDVPVLVVQGRRDPFGSPPRKRGRKVVLVDGDHALRANVPAIERAVGSWLRALL